MSSHPEIALDEDEIYALSRRGFTIRKSFLTLHNCLHFYTFLR